jgi:branched-chain amino acid transport system substrate-binding protein
MRGLQTGIAFLLGVVWLFVGCTRDGNVARDGTNESGGETYKIGVVAPLTGPAAEAGTALRQGAQLASEEINSAGGMDIGGKKIKLELIFEDSTSKPEVGVSVAEKLLGRDRVRLLVGEAFHSHVTMAIMELASKYPEIPFVSWEPVSAAIADKVVKEPARYKNFWKGDYNSDAYARSVFNTIKFLASSSQWTARTRTLAFVVEDTDYGRSNAADASKLFENDGWKTATVETVPLGHTDFYPQLNKVKTLAPELVVTVFTGLASGVAFVKQYQEVGVKALHMAVYYPTRPEFIDQAGQASEGLIWTALMFHPGSLKHQAAMANAVQKKFSVRATSDHAYGYDGVSYIADALKRAGSTTGAKVNEALSRNEFRGVLGRYVFDPQSHHAKDGAEFLPVPTAQIQGGKNVIIWPENVAASKYQLQPWTR